MQITPSPHKPILKSIPIPTMEKTWIFPKKSYIKINAHAVSYPQPLANGNHSGIGIVLRDDKGSIILMVSGGLADITERASELWALLLGLQCAFAEGENNIQMETDNEDAAREWVDWRWFLDPNHSSVIQQLEQRISDPNLHLEKIQVVIPNQNRLARFLAVDGAQNRDRLVIFRRPFGLVKELWRLDMGLGPLIDRFMLVEEEEYEEAQAEELQDMDDQMMQDMGIPHMGGLHANGEVVIGLPLENGNHGNAGMMGAAEVQGVAGLNGASDGAVLAPN